MNMSDKNTRGKKISINSGPQARELNPLLLSFEGRHLIEASAGTGKTFNITRLYVRLLVEKSYSVQQILVMTFTDAATEEIRARVAQFIDEVLLNWESDDPFIRELQTRTDKDQGKRLLQSAKLTIDDASIFTIHGFCQRVITQFSASMKQDPDFAILPQTEPLFMQALADVIIGMDKNGTAFSLLQANNWYTPAKFYHAFKELLYYQDDILLLSAQNIWDEYMEQAKQHWQATANARQQLIKSLTESDEWLDGMASTAKNTKKIALEKQSAIDFLQGQELLSAGQEQVLFEELQAYDFKGMIDKKLLDPGLLSLFSTTRLKKYSEPFKDQQVKLFDEIFDAIKAPLRVKTDNRLDKRMTLSFAHKVVLDVIKQVKLRVAVSMQQDSLLSYDDLIRTVADGLKADNADVMTTHLQKQFPVALVDEFQDTDHQQYQIFSRLYQKASLNTALIMIGDPKQAIYGFRGGDVFTYLQARYDADYVWSMDTNWRSTQDMVAAYNFVFTAPETNHLQHASVFDYGIDYLPITAAQGNKIEASTLRVLHSSAAQALQFVCADAYLENEKFTDVEQQRKQILQWMVNEINSLLAEGVIEDKHGSRPVQSQDIAVLVRAGFEADMIRLCLQQNQLASVYLSEKSPLFESIQAHHLYYVLDAIWTGNDQRRCITALATGLFFDRPNKIASATHKATENDSQDPYQISELIADGKHSGWQDVYRQNAAYRQIWQKQGIYALLMHLIKQQLKLSELNDQPERALTNYQHLAELMAKAAVMHTTPSAQLMWLAKQIHQIDKDDTAQLRLESDQGLIKIVTQHKSKGLEYPIVFLPFANTARKNKNGQILKYHNSDNSLVMQLGANDIGRTAMEQETLAEDMRLLYVALTRPIYRCYLGMLLTPLADKSAIHRALALPKLSDEIESAKENIQVSDDVHVNDDHQVNDGHSQDQSTKNYADVLLMQIAELSKGNKSIGVRKASEYFESASLPAPKVLPELTINQLTRRIEQNWILTSFTGITRLMHAQEADEPFTSRMLREPEIMPEQLPDQVLEPAKAGALVVSQLKHAQHQALRFSMSKGANTGNILHDSLEWLSFCAPDFDKVLKQVAQRHSEFEVVDSGEYQQWLQECLNAPMSEPKKTRQTEVSQAQASLSLASLQDNKTIKESEFYLPINGLNSRGLEQVLGAHRSRVANRFGFTPVPVKALSKQNIAGMLHGFIDLVFSYQGQYFVSDYKSTYLGSDYSDYCPRAIAENIQEHDYDLQYLLYAMALDRYLEQSLASYVREKHFGGVYYLYLRGMTDDAKHWLEGLSPGVYFSVIKAQELAQLNALFAMPSSATLSPEENA